MSNITKYEGGSTPETKGFNIFSKDWWKSDKNKATAFVMIAILAYPTFLFLTHAVPWLTTVSWNLTKMLGAIVVTGFSALVLTNKRLWRAFKYISEFIGRYTLGLAIELNEFNVLEMQIEEAEKDREKLKKQGTVVSGKKIELEDKIKVKQKFLTEAISMVKLTEKRIEQAQRVNDFEEIDTLSGDLELEATKVAAAKDYVDTLTPIAEDLAFLEKHFKKVYRLCGIKNQKARVELTIGRDKYEAVMSGTGVARAAFRALVGSDDMNRDAEYAIQSLQRKVSNTLAETKNTIELSTDIIRSLEKENTVRAKRGIDLIREMDQKGQTDYETEATGDFKKSIPTTPNSGYASLLLNQPSTANPIRQTYVGLPKQSEKVYANLLIGDNTPKHTKTFTNYQVIQDSDD